MKFDNAIQIALDQVINQRLKKSTKWISQVSNIDEYVCINAINSGTLWSKYLLGHNNNLCCLKLCERLQSGVSGGFTLYCTFWTSVTYFYILWMLLFYVMTTLIFNSSENWVDWFSLKSSLISNYVKTI